MKHDYTRIARSPDHPEKNGVYQAIPVADGDAAAKDDDLVQRFSTPMYALFEDGIWGCSYPSIREAEEAPLFEFADQQKYWRGLNSEPTKCQRLGLCMHTQRACQPGQCVGPETILPLDPYPDTDSADEFLRIAAALALVGLAVALGAGIVGYFVGGM